MGWADEVHDRRVFHSLREARIERKARQLGYTVDVKPNTDALPFVAIMGLLAGVTCWQVEGHRVRQKLKPWKTWPIVKQFVALFDTPTPVSDKNIKAKPKSKSLKSQSAPQGRQTQAAGASDGNAQSLHTVSLNAPRPTGSSSPQPQASTSQPSASPPAKSGSKKKKKKNKKK